MSPTSSPLLRSSWTVSPESLSFPCSRDTKVAMAELSVGYAGFCNVVDVARVVAPHPDARIATVATRLTANMRMTVLLNRTGGVEARLVPWLRSEELASLQLASIREGRQASARSRWLEPSRLP